MSKAKNRFCPMEGGGEAGVELPPKIFSLIRFPFGLVGLGMAALMLGALFTVPTWGKTVDSIELVVDQDSMTQGEMEEAIQAYFLSQHLNPSKPGTPDYETAKKQVVENFEREVLLAEEADREKIDIQDGEVQHEVDEQIENMKKSFPTEQDFEDEIKKEGITLEDLKSEIHDQLLRRLKATHVLRQKQQDLPNSIFVTDEEVREYFHAHPKDYEQAKFSIILFRIPPKSTSKYVAELEKQAQGVLKDLKGGASFATLAKKYSEDEGTADKGGDVGTVYRADLDPALAKGIFEIPVKGMGVVHTPDGVYVVKVEFRGTADYTSVAPDIKDHLKKQKQENAIGQWVDSLKKDAYIVEDGKVIAYKPSESTNPSSAITNPIASNSGSTGVTTDTSQGPTTAEGETSSTSAQGSTFSSETFSGEGIYPTLPDPGCFAFSFGLDGFNYGTDDLSSYYGTGTLTNQNFPFGIGLDLGMDMAVDSTFQVGIKLEALRKTAENITDNRGDNEQWTSAAAGVELGAKLLIPLDESTNFYLSAAGGYYLMLGSSVTISSDVTEENADLAANAPGGEANAGIEFFLDGNKDTALDLEVGYRYLKFSDITSTLTTDNNGPSTFPTPLVDPNGTQSTIDFSGIRAGLGLKFYLDKGGS